jgi:FecR protein
MTHRWILCWALTPLLGLPALAQPVISAHSGLINYSDGSVFLNDQRVEQKTGKFDQMSNGSELRTQDGRVEVLLTPGTFLRMGPNSAIRMISNELDNTRVELLNGAAMVDQGSDTLADTAVTILYNLDEVHIKKAGRYRIDSQPPQVKVEKGAADVMADGKTVEAGAGYVVPLEGKLTARKLLNDPSTPTSGDDLEQWNTARDQSVTSSNLDAAATADLGGVVNGWQNDPDAVLQSLGIAPYPPGMSSYIPPYSYGGLYGVDPYSASLYGVPLYGSALYGAGPAFGLYGVSPLAQYYAMPLYLPYRYSYSGIGGLGYRRPLTIPGPIGIGGRPIYRSPSVIRMPSISRPSFGIGGRPSFGGVGRPMGGGGIHVGGHR